MRTTFLAALAVSLASAPALAWDSAHPLNRTHPTHTYLTECALQRAGLPELEKYRAVLIDGANSELHELPIKGSKYGIDLDAKRQQHKAPTRARPTSPAGGRKASPPIARAAWSRPSSTSA